MFPDPAAMTRRGFLRACGVLGVGAITGGAARAAFDLASLGGGAKKASETRFAMGTFVSITAIDHSTARAEDAIGLAFAEMDRLIGIFSRYDGTSPLSVLNRDARVSLPPSELVDLLRAARRFGSQTEGAFDVTVGPLLDLFATSAAHGGPSDEEIEHALSLVDHRNVAVGPREISLDRAEMRLTLDGIAKGYIVDRMSEILESHGVRHHLINAGGDIRTRGERVPGQPWTVAVQDPQKGGHFPDVMKVANASIATSGSYEIYFGEDRVFHHIVDPKLGRSPRHLTSVTVRAPSVMMADALSTAVFVLPGARGMQVVNSMNDVACLTVGNDGKITRSDRWA